MASNETLSSDKPMDTPFQAESPRGRPVLVVFESEEMMEWHLITRAATRIGRDLEVDIALRDDTASRLHAVIHYDNIDQPDQLPECRIEDLKSRNGTFLNGTRLAGTAPLRSGDRIRIGNASAIFQLRSDHEIDADVRLRNMAMTDILTGLHNRAWLAQLSRREVDRAQRYGRPLSFMLADLDDFKKINDTYGHLAGDAVLEQFGELMLDRKRAHDLAARYGGEEFCLLLPETSMQGAIVMAERLRIATENLVFNCEGAQIHATVSVGVAQLTRHDGTHFERLVERADIALYRAKALGKNRVCTADIGDEPTR